MNIAFFLRPKSQTAYLYEDFTFRQGLEKMRNHGYTAIPVITRAGQYIGTVSEGDFLWHIWEGATAGESISIRHLEKLRVKDILGSKNYPSVGITASTKDLVANAMSQNFIPVVDDLGNFIGIVTRSDVIRYLMDGKSPIPEKTQATNE